MSDPDPLSRIIFAPLLSALARSALAFCTARLAASSIPRINDRGKRWKVDGMTAW